MQNENYVVSIIHSILGIQLSDMLQPSPVSSIPSIYIIFLSQESPRSAFQTWRIFKI